MELISLWLQPYWQMLAYACLGFVGCVGVLAVASPRLFTWLATKSNKWFDTSKMDELADKMIDVDTFALRHCRMYGAVVLFTSVVVGIIPAVEPSWKPIAYGCLAVAGFFGLLAVVSPRWFIKLSTKANTWIDTSKFCEFIEKPIEVDIMAIRHCRAFGGILLVAAAVVAFV